MDFIEKQLGSKSETKDIRKKDQEAAKAPSNLIPQSESDGVINDVSYAAVRQTITQTHSELVWRAFSDPEAKEELREYLRTTTSATIRSILKTDAQIDYLLSELVGLGLFEDLINEPGVTDIGFNGTDLIIQTNTRKYKYPEPVSEDYIHKIIVKMANGLGKTFSPKEPVLDGVFGNYRINAVHRAASPMGTTMSLRVSHKAMVLNPGNFNVFAPMYVLDMLEALVLAHCNILISGQTGTGKTELQKLLVSFIPFNDKIIVIEDVQEMHVKELFPEKDILSWVTGPSKSIADFVKISLRNNPEWVIVSETRGSEAYEMFQAVLSGSYIITTLHAPDAHKVPDRFVNMITDEYQNANEERLERNILENFNIGIHIEYIDMEIPQGEGKPPRHKRVRYASEVVEYTPDGIVSLFRQRFVRGKWEIEPDGDLSDRIYNRIAKAGLEYRWGGKELRGQEEEKEI